MLHEGPQGLGDNVMPHFANPERIEETDGDGDVIGVRYEYPADENMLLNDLTPLLEGAGVDLVHNGHSHLWNRFVSENGVNYLETSNTGNSYGAYHPLSGRSRPLPPLPWDASNYLAQGNPGGLEPIVPNVKPFLDETTGEPEPFVQDNHLAVFAMLDTGANELVSYAYDVRTPGTAPWVIDRFSLGREKPVEPSPEPTGSPEPTSEPTASPEPTDEPGDGPALSLGASTVAAGGTVTVSAAGLEPGGLVTIELRSTPVTLARVAADATGALRATVTIPASTSPGQHRIVVTDPSGATASAPITVTSAALAATGGAPVAPWLAGGAAALLLAGAAVLVARRARRA
jgi:hypothetical protein